jgi:uncharacterized protein (DUF58 family)
MAELPLLLLLLLLLAVLLRLDLVFYLVYVLTGVYVLARWWTARSIVSLSIEREFVDHIFTGESTRVILRIENHGLLPIPWLRYQETSDLALGGGAVNVALSLGSRKRVELEYSLDGRRRGVYEVGPGRVVTGDVFGFVEAHGRSITAARLVVYPIVIPLAHLNLTSRAPYGTITTREPVFADPARVVGIRSYAPGDPLRSIDWKTSARVGALQVRKVSPAVSVATVIFLDMQSQAFSRQSRSTVSEWGVVVAASLASHLQWSRQPVGMGSNGEDAIDGTQSWVIAARSGSAHLMKLLEWLARVQLAETVSLADWLPSATVSLAWGTTVVAVTPSGDEATCAALGRLRIAGLNPVLVVIEPYAHFGVVQHRARRLGVMAHQVASEIDLRRWQAGASRTFLPTGARRD